MASIANKFHPPCQLSFTGGDFLEDSEAVSLFKRKDSFTGLLTFIKWAGRWGRLERGPLPSRLSVEHQGVQTTVWMAFKYSPVVLTQEHKCKFGHDERSGWCSPVRTPGFLSPAFSLSWSIFKWHKGPGLGSHCATWAAQHRTEELRFWKQLSGSHTGSAICGWGKLGKLPNFSVPQFSHL